MWYNFMGGGGAKISLISVGFYLIYINFCMYDSLYQNSRSKSL